MASLRLSPTLSVICFRRGDHCKNGPYFVVREFDTKVIRAQDAGLKGRGPSEQAIRASIRQAILNLHLRSERASKAEIRLLKSQAILGKRAPSCSLLPADDMIRLLRAFGKNQCAHNLHQAILTNRASFPGLVVQSLAVADTPSRTHIKVAGGKRMMSPTTHAAPQPTKKIKRARKTAPGPPPPPLPLVSPSYVPTLPPPTQAPSPAPAGTSGLDALLSAMKALDKQQTSNAALPAAIPSLPSAIPSLPSAHHHSPSKAAPSSSYSLLPVPLWAKTPSPTFKRGAGGHWVHRTPLFPLMARGNGTLTPSQLIMSPGRLQIAREDQFSPAPPSPPISPRADPPAPGPFQPYAT